MSLSMETYVLRRIFGILGLSDLSPLIFMPNAFGLAPTGSRYERRPGITCRRVTVPARSKVSGPEEAFS